MFTGLIYQPQGGSAAYLTHDLELLGNLHFSFSPSSRKNRLPVRFTANAGRAKEKKVDDVNIGIPRPIQTRAYNTTSSMIASPVVGNCSVCG